MSLLLLRMRLRGLLVIHEVQDLLVKESKRVEDQDRLLPRCFIGFNSYRGQSAAWCDRQPGTRSRSVVEVVLPADTLSGEYCGLSGLVCGLH